MPPSKGSAEISRAVQLLGDMRQRSLVSADVFGQAALRCVTAKERSRATLRGELLELVMADRAGVGQVKDSHFLLFAEPPGALAGLSEQDQVLRHLIPNHSVNALEIEPLAD